MAGEWRQTVMGCLPIPPEFSPCSTLTLQGFPTLPQVTTQKGNTPGETSLLG